MDLPGYCIFGVQGGIDEDEPYILGNVFLKNFYVIYDYENFKIGLALHTSSKAKIMGVTRTWIVALIIIIVLSIVGLVIYCWYRKKQLQS